MKPSAGRLFLTWIVGAMVGTVLVGVTSPLFVRSYVPLSADPVRGVWTLPEGHVYRWRSEGYADSQIGPLGMPGRVSLKPPNTKALRVAIWGDSQAEGVCVSDHQKLFAQVEQLSYGAVAAFPLSRSGEDAADWVTQMPAIDRELGVDLHVILLVDLPDLLAATGAPIPPPSDADVVQASNAIAARLPAFVIQAARHLLTEDDGVTRRKLRFGIGPIDTNVAREATERATISRVVDWDAPLRAVAEATEQPIVILYVPKLPQIVAGTVVIADADAESFAALSSVCSEHDIAVIDLRDRLLEMAGRGRWPHGFHNGQIGVGHLNHRGYSVIAQALVEKIEQDFFGQGI